MSLNIYQRLKLRRWLCWVISAMFLFLAVPIPSFGQTDEHLKEFLRAYLGDPALSPDRSTRFTSKAVRLGPDQTDQLIVYIVSDTLCGSGGCMTLVLDQTGSSYKVIAWISVSRLPISVLPTKTKGWSDLGVWVQGGGIQPGYEALVPFRGRKYAGNPSVAPSRRTPTPDRGDVVIPRGASMSPLYD